MDAGNDNFVMVLGEAECFVRDVGDWAGSVGAAGDCRQAECAVFVAAVLNAQEGAGAGLVSGDCIGSCARQSEGGSHRVGNQAFPQLDRRDVHPGTRSGACRRLVCHGERRTEHVDGGGFRHVSKDLIRRLLLIVPTLFGILVINFLIVAIALFCLIRVINKLQAPPPEAAPAEAPPPPEDILLLREIRDSLRK